MSFWAKSERFSPILVRLLARRKNGPPLTDAEISAASGLPTHQVFVMSQSLNWAGIDLPTMRAFLTGCQIDFEDYRRMHQIQVYLASKPSWKYLRTSPLWKPLFQPLMVKYFKNHSPTLRNNEIQQTPLHRGYNSDRRHPKR